MSGTGALDASVTLDDVFSVLETKRVPLAPELAGYLVLEIAEHADPNGGDVDPRRVFVGEEGTVALVKPRRDAASHGSAEPSVRMMLARLLEASGSQTPALAAASKRKSGAGLPALAEELEAALIPVNRAAGRRALARLAREVRRVMLGVGRNALPSSSEVSAQARRPYPSSHTAIDRGARPPQDFSADEDPTTRRPNVNELTERTRPAEPTTLPARRTPSPSQEAIDELIEQFGASNASAHMHARALKAMAGLDPTPAPVSAARSDGADPGSEVDALLEARPGQSPPDIESRQLPTQPSAIRRARAPLSSVPTATVPARTGISVAVPVIAVLAIACGAYAIWRLRPGPAPRRVIADGAGRPSASTAARASGCRGTIVVSNAPPLAEVLLRQGQAPLDVERMPVGARLEFVATAEGFAPKRVVIPAGATWDIGADGKARIETAVQLDRAKGGNEPWPSADADGDVGGQGPPGTVHVVSTPRGAEVWLVAGGGPSARMDQIRCDRDIDVLVAGPTTFRRRIHLSPRDFQIDDPGQPPVARVTVK